jgi:Nif-specific regulatory protein
MVGESTAMLRVFEMIARVAPSDSTVLLLGENGTGKDLAAHAIHTNSARAAKPFVVVNCAALTETLLESELFGHEKGAFTGAITQKRGKLEVADGGTVFLDEIGELNGVLQSKLLRVLQQREFERVGGVKTIRIDVRFIAATNRNLEEAVAAGNFRQDLYYRLNVVKLLIPPLRDRREDIPLLALYFTAKYSTKTKRRVTGISPEARDLLVRYDWPGNIRELENAMERAVVLGTTESILPDDLPESIWESESKTGPARNFHEAVNQAKKEIVQSAIEQAGGNYSNAARLLGLHPNNFHRLMRSLQITK